MLSKLVELLSGKDALERMACLEDPDRLLDYLLTHEFLVPIRPQQFLDADTATDEELMESIEASAEATAGDAVDLWTEEIDGKIRLPAFSSPKRAEAFGAALSQQLNMIFGLGCVPVLLSDVLATQHIDFVDFNRFSKGSFELDVAQFLQSGGDDE